MSVSPRPSSRIPALKLFDSPIIVPGDTKSPRLRRRSSSGTLYISIPSSVSTSTTAIEFSIVIVLISPLVSDLNTLCVKNLVGTLFHCQA